MNKGDNKILIFDPLNRLEWMVCLSLLFFSGFYFLLEAKKREQKDEKYIFLGFSVLFIGLGFNRFFFFLSDYFVVGHYSGHSYYGDYTNVEPLYNVMFQIAYLNFLIGATLCFFAIEKILKKTRFGFTIINLVFITLFFIVPGDILTVVMYGFIFFDVLFSILIFFWIAKISGPEFQAVSLLMMMGFILMLIGNILSSPAILLLEIVWSKTAPFYIIAGALVSISPMFLNPKYLSKTILSWYVFAFFVSYFVVQGLILIFIARITLFYLILIWFAIIAGFGFLTYSILRIVKLNNAANTANTLKKPENIDKSDNQINILKKFLRPDRFTEQEVAAYKEKKICIVCKGPAKRYVFICDGCDTLYCSNCAKALSNLENLCWVCDAPLDESKPVKKAPKEEIKVDDIQFGKAKKDNKLVKGA